MKLRLTFLNTFSIIALFLTIHTTGFACDLVTDSYNQSKSSNYISNHCPGTTSIVVPDGVVLTLHGGGVDLTALGITELTILGSGSIEFANSESINLSGAGVLIIDDVTNTNALVFTGNNVGSASITIGSRTYNDPEFPGIISSGGANESGELPVEMASFGVELYNKKPLLSWTTASEIDNHGFEIERTTDLKNWESIDFVNGNGTTTEFSYYTAMDEDAPFGIVYYRLKIIDFDGEYEYSDVVSIELDKPTTSFAIFPNPTTNFVNIDTKTQSSPTVSIFDINGKELSQLTFVEKYTVDVSHLDSGLYVVLVTTDGITSEQKLIIN